MPGEPNAASVVLFKKGEFQMAGYGAQLGNQNSALYVQVRLKILTEEGKSNGEITIAHSPTHPLNTRSAPRSSRATPWIGSLVGSTSKVTVRVGRLSTGHVSKCFLLGSFRREGSSLIFYAAAIGHRPPSISSPTPAVPLRGFVCRYVLAAKRVCELVS